MNPDSGDQSTYLAYFGLNHAPFTDLNQPKFHSHAITTQRLDLLLHLTQFSQRQLFLKGLHGSGKSTLLKQFIKRAEDNWQTCRIEATLSTSADGIVSELNRCFGLKENNTFEQLNERLTDISRDGERPVIVVDEAHLLPVDSVIALLQITDSHHESDDKTATLILCGEPSLETTLATPVVAALLPEGPQVVELPAMDSAQLRDYLQAHLRAAGRSGDLPFSAAQIEQLHQQSEGLPGKLNTLAQQMIEMMAPTSTPATETIDTPRHKKSGPIGRYLLIGALVIAVGTILIFQKQINQLFNVEQSSAQTNDPTTSQSQSISRPVESTSITPAPQPILRTAPEPEPVEPPAPTSIKSSTAKPLPSAPSITDTAPAPIAVTNKPPPATTPTTATLTYHTEEWLLAQRPTAYALQLLGVENEQSVIDYIQEHRIEQQAAYFATIKNGKPWFALLYGLYPSYEAAQAAKTRLPVSLNRYTPWPRSLASVHAEIRKHP
ncbi:hypothetical protein BOW53_00115 [Solemya pervernicosa gill symbiont]|uniref:SPOR domain-containing protein n=2 Tax=Gammaproteobacteria incertae sedis TaxID=118884 RepID=A0A1T2LBF5_9GAMM|nr:AAA family ATPase [Candidatus Reidiella endopervernicosa]OOZ42286.1 hypothetical protein BOW53_00115 [Solemya pervernicosa gill symbiont]QKQ25683.1 AAA family ATPase [Candidatus Reidiella endopervernicosa]